FALRVLHFKSEIRNRKLARRNLPLRLQRSIRGKFFSYVHSGDEPKFVWTGGPYAWVRNPFYDSYLITYASAAIMMPDLIMLEVLLVMLWFFRSAARHEERKFLR